jgi:regulatory protein
MSTPSPSLKGRALRHLAAREHSRAELEQKLRPHEEQPGQLARLLDELVARDLLSEARAVESLIHRRSQRFGAAKLRHELGRKGIGREQVDAAMEGLKPTELARARAVRQQKFGSQAGDAQQRARQMRFLAARGFSAEVIRQAVTGADDED